MLFSTLLFATAAWAAAVPQGDDSTNELNFQLGLPENYTVSDIQWRGFEGFGEDQVFTGTIENVISQMRQIKGADYTPSFVSKAESHATTPLPDYHAARHNIDCGGPEADPRRIDQGVDYLNHIPDSSLCGNAPKTCGRISCSWNSAIWLCNDRTDNDNVRKCNMFGQYAAEINKECAIYDSNPRVAGKNSDDQLLLSVLVKKASC
ncbi:hypothetical protein O1611_g7837 [Lasiodiplodia mahajangana]|uniref:Uncharacterized protein n=1 Tax=Lasiodiplodia mahajangana TaxID=1108764 RepID=A0ACC2JES3_9PEZI|nr:hypothetical protein O1611_g7837 [Lasiodiplodia mahajangana]